MVRSVGKMVAGVLLLILGLLCAGILVYGLVTDLSIWVLGRRTMAEVLDLWVERTSESDAQELTFEYFASYRFTIPGGKTITSSSKLDVREWGSLEKGGDVSVVYFPPIPRHNRVDEARFVPMLAQFGRGLVYAPTHARSYMVVFTPGGCVIFLPQAVSFSVFERYTRWTQMWRAGAV